MPTGYYAKRVRRNVKKNGDDDCEDLHIGTEPSCKRVALRAECYSCRIRM